MINNQAEIQRNLIRKAALPKNKFNFPLHNHVESMADEVSDRTAADIGMEMELKANEN